MLYLGNRKRWFITKEQQDMIGMVLVSHGRLAEEFRAALVHVVGPQPQLAVINIEADDDMERRRSDIMSAIHGVDTGQGVVILTDMFGGTPSNLAISAMNGSNVEVVAGINLPMLIKLASIRDECVLADAVVQAQDAGRKYINVASRVLAGR
jgi:mannose PTS system EIIA component